MMLSNGATSVPPTWDDFEFWRSGEWQVIEEKLDDLDKEGKIYCPKREDLFNALDAVDLADVKVAIMGQDPYPDPRYATGIAFSIPVGTLPIPASLHNIYTELHSDLDIRIPKHGNLDKWVKQGILLWNAYPSCLEGKPGSHHWTEWTYLTKEIVESLDKREKVIFVLLGAQARSYKQYIKNNVVIETSHPSPLGVNHGFFGSKIFSQVNDQLKTWKKAQINWRV